MTKEQSYTRFWEGSKRMWITFLFFSFYYGLALCRLPIRRLPRQQLL